MGRENVGQDGTEFLDHVDSKATVVSAGRPDIANEERPGHRLVEAVREMRRNGDFERPETDEKHDKPRDNVYRGPRIDVGIREGAWSEGRDLSKESD